MAQDRTQLALDRTTLAWIRTALTMATFGLGMVGFFRSLRQSAPSAETIRLHQAAIHFGEALLVIGNVALLGIAVAHWLGAAYPE
jgi:inner membrane protein YidH